MDLASLRQSPPDARAALSAATVVAFDDVAYVILAATQPGGFGARNAFVAAVLAATAALVVTGVRTQRGTELRSAVVTVAGTWALVIGVLGSFSLIGLPLLVAAGLSIYTLTRAPVSINAVIVGVVLGVAGLVLGFAFIG